MMLTLCMLPMLSALFSGATLETFNAPLYPNETCGAWYAPGEATSDMPLGGLGTGFIDLTSAGHFGNMTIENNWLNPSPASPKSGLTLRVGDKTVELFPDKEPPQAMRFWGHYPAADLDFKDTFGDTEVYMRALAPMIPREYDTSGMPLALFRFRVTNKSAADVPVELSLQWEQPMDEAGKAEGNVEGALAWQREALAPGATWTITANLLFAASPEEALQKAQDPMLPGRRIEGAQVPEGFAYANADVTDLLLDALGGFNWEANKRQSATFKGAPTIGQILWQLGYDGKTAGRGLKGPHGLAVNEFPTRTQDNALQIDSRVQVAGNNIFQMCFDVKNISSETIRDLSFTYSVNADLGGPEKSEHQKAEYVPAAKGILFSAQEGVSLLLFSSDLAGFVASTWPQAHELADAGKWTPAAQAAAPARRQTSSISDGIQIFAQYGTVAVAARGDEEDWTVQSIQTGDTIIRTLATKTLGVGETSVVTLALAWHFPQWLSSDAETLRHKYASYADAGAVITDAMPRAVRIEQSVVAWQNRIYRSKTAPAQLKDAVINSLYILPRNSWWLDDGRFFQSESFTGCPITETFVCRYYGTFPLVLMWPELEKATMQSVAKAQAESGEIPFGFGSPAASRSPYFHVQHPIVSAEFVLNAWRDYHLTGDKEFAMYDTVQRALRYAMTLDKDGDGLINEDPGSEKGFPANQYYDIWPWWGTSAYTGGIWLAALRAGEELAKENGDDAFATELRGWFDRGRAAYDEKLWTGEYYRLYNDPANKRKSDTLLANALCGQWYAYATALGPILPLDKINSHIDSVLRLNAKATEFGTVNGVTPDGKPDITFPDHSAVLTIGETWCFASMTAFAGRIDDALPLFNRSYDNILINQRTPWNIPWSLDPKTGAIKWGINYYSNPCVWTLFQAVDPETYLGFANE